MSSSERKKKHTNFVSEPMRDKPINALPGIDQQLETLLSKKGFDQAYVLLGQFLVLKKDREMFIEWMLDIVETKESSTLVKKANKIYEAFLEWSQNFLD